MNHMLIKKKYIFKENFKGTDDKKLELEFIVIVQVNIEGNPQHM